MLPGVADTAQHKRLHQNYVSSGVTGEATRHSGGAGTHGSRPAVGSAGDGDQHPTAALQELRIAQSGAGGRATPRQFNQSVIP